MNFFILAYSHYEDYVPYFFSGPDVSEEDFNVLCQSLVPQAGISATQLTDPDDFIGWNEIVLCIIPFLELNGFTHINPKKAEIFGPGIITNKRHDDNLFLLKDSSSLIFSHNKRIEKSLFDEVIDPVNKD